MELQVIRYIFRGSQDEYRSVQSLFERDTQAEISSGAFSTDEGDTPVSSQGGVQLSKADVRRVLERRPALTSDHNYIRLFKVLEDLDNAFISRSVLMQRLELGDDPAVFSGIIGSLGRRINQTPNIPRAQSPHVPLELLLDVKHEDDEWYYRMRQELREALKDLGYI